MGMSADSQSEYDCTLSATVKSTEDFTFTFDVPAVMGGLKITFLPGNPPAELLLSGSYTGTLTMSVMGSAMDPMEEAQVSLAVEGDVWTLTLPEMGMGSMSIAESIEAVSGETSITGSLTGTVSADGSTMTLSAEITPGAMPMSINVDFEGTK